MIIFREHLIDTLGNYDLVLLLSNSFVKAEGSLTLGKGLPKEVNSLTDGNLSYVFGGYIKHMYPTSYKYPEVVKYGCVVPFDVENNNRVYLYGSAIGLFQTRYHFNGSHDQQLIKYSVEMLHEIAKKYNTVALPCLTTDFGLLTEATTDRIYKSLPDNVDVIKLQ
jgi:hypothetical protein